MEAGKIYTLTVLRETEIGYILGDSKSIDEVFLHRNDCGSIIPKVGEKYRAFLYYDHKKRLCATLLIPKITVFDCGFGEVKTVTNFGVFVDIGINKDILLSSDDLPKQKHLWPQAGDVVFGYLVNDNNGLLFELGTRDDFEDFKKSAPKELKGNKIKGRVMRIVEEGVNIFTNEGYLGFIHKSQLKDPLRLGLEITGRVINVKDDGEINLSLLPQKELAIKDDKKLILDYLASHGGKMPLGDESTPEEITRVLNISKARFKRALGALLKEDKVYQAISKRETLLK